MNRSGCWWLHPAMVGFSYGCGLLCLHPDTPWMLPGAKPINLGEKTLLCAHLLFSRVTGWKSPVPRAARAAWPQPRLNPWGKHHEQVEFYYFFKGMF